MKLIDTIRGAAAAAALVIGFGVTGASAALITCGNATATFALSSATEGLCVSGDNDVGAGGFFASDPSVFGVSGWMLAENNEDGSGSGLIAFLTAPVNGTEIGTWSISSILGLTNVAIALKAGNGFGLFLIDSLSGTWESSRELSHASIWYAGTPTPIPLPATGLLLLGALGALGLMRRRKSI